MCQCNVSAAALRERTQDAAGADVQLPRKTAHARQINTPAAEQIERAAAGHRHVIQGQQCAVAQRCANAATRDAQRVGVDDPTATEHRAVCQLQHWAAACNVQCAINQQLVAEHQRATACTEQGHAVTRLNLQLRARGLHECAAHRQQLRAVAHAQYTIGKVELRAGRDLQHA